MAKFRGTQAASLFQRAACPAALVEFIDASISS
jgi:hypothetical protein